MHDSARVILTPGAKADLSDIARYTKKEWGKKQAIKYAELLDQCFEKIAACKDISKSVLPNNKMVRVCRCEHHYVFYFRQGKREKPVILAVLHERMNLMQHLKGRLQG